MVPVGLTSHVACRPCWGPWYFWEPVQFCSGLVTQMAERSTLSPGSAGPDLHDNRFGMETWHTGCQEVTAAKKNVSGVKEQLGKRLRGSLQHFQSYRRLSSLAPCAGAFKTILREVMAIENESSQILCISIFYYLFITEMENTESKNTFFAPQTL